MKKSLGYLTKLIGYVALISILAPSWLVGYLSAAIVAGYRRGQQDFNEVGQ